MAGLRNVLKIIKNGRKLLLFLCFQVGMAEFLVEKKSKEKYHLVIGNHNRGLDSHQKSKDLHRRQSMANPYRVNTQEWQDIIILRSERCPLTILHPI